MLNQKRLWNTCGLLATCFALASLGLGCDEKKPPAEGAASATAVQTALPTPVAAKALAELAAPPEVVAFGGTDDFQKLVTDVAKLAESLAPGTMPPPALLTQGLAQKLKLKNADAIDFSKPARFVLVDPKKHDQPLALIVGTKGKAALLGSLPAEKKENDAGNAYSWTTESGKTAYLNFIGDAAVLSPSKDIYPAHKAFLEQVLGAKLPAPVAIVGAMANISQLYGADVTQGLELAKEQMKKAAATGPGGGGAQAAQIQGAAAMLDWLTQSMKELDRVVLTANLPADGALLSLRLHPKPGTELDKGFKLLAAKPLGLLAKLPADAPFVFAMSLDPDKTGELTRKLIGWALTVGMAGQELPEKYLAAMNDYWQATTGEFAVAAHKSLTGEGMTLTGLMGLRDAEKARASMKLVGAMYKEPGVAETYKKMGMQIQLTDEAYKIGDVPVTTQQVKFQGPVAGLGPMGPVLQDLLFTHTAMAKDVGYISYGQEGKATLEAFLGGKVTGGLDQAPGLVRAKKNAPAGTFFLMYAEPLDVARGIHLGGKNPFAAQLAEVPPSTTGLCISGGAQAGVVDITIDVPTDQAKAIVQVAMLLQGVGQGLGLPPGGPGAMGGPSGLPAPKPVQ